MHKRLFWNFETDGAPFANLLPQPVSDTQVHRWELRYFWPDDKPIFLRGMDEPFFDVSQYKAVRRDDLYQVLPDLPFNLKLRNNHLLYKPLLVREDNLYGYGKKLNLSDLSPDTALPGLPDLTAGKLVEMAARTARIIPVTKTALIHTVRGNPAAKIEFSRFHIRNRIAFGLCIESAFAECTTALASHLMPDGLSMDYISYLNRENP